MKTSSQKNDLGFKERPKFIVTPGLEYSVIEFETLCKISAQKPIMIVGPTGVGKSLFCIFSEKFIKNKTVKWTVKMKMCLL